MKKDKKVINLGMLYDEESSCRFDFDKLKAMPISYYLNPLDIQALNKIATSIKYQSNVKEKFKSMDRIMKRRGFVKYACGTNRRIYRFLEDDSILMKVAYDRVGIEDNPNEFVNQNYLKPFVSKMYDVTPCGTVGLVERIEPIRTREQFEANGDQIFDLLYFNIIGKYALDDIGTDAFMNYGIRKGFGPCILDYAYLYELDEDKLHCKHKLNGHRCNGLIDYSTDFNTLICERCGRTFTAKEIGKVPVSDKKEDSPIIEDCLSGNESFGVKIVDKDGNVVLDNSDKESDIIY